MEQQLNLQEENEEKAAFTENLSEETARESAAISRADRVMATIRRQARLLKLFLNINRWSTIVLFLNLVGCLVPYFLYSYRLGHFPTISYQPHNWYIFTEYNDLTNRFTMGAWWNASLYVNVFCSVGATYMAKRLGKGAKRLAEFKELRSIATLAEVLNTRDKQAKAIAAEALPPLLNRLQATDAALLNITQRGYLDKQLSGKNKLLVLAILKGLEQVGDSEDLAFVEGLANGRGKLRKDPEVREAAKQCLAYLERRAEMEKASKMLLRPAEASGGDEMLLRAAGGAGDNNPDHLLRPTGAE
jgi:hypothetical protein